MSVPTRLIDTHLHLVYRDSLAYAWLGSEPVLAAQDWAYERHAAEAHTLGLTGCLHMEVDVAETDIDRETEFIRHLAGDSARHLRAAIANGLKRPSTPSAGSASSGGSDRPWSAQCASLTAWVAATRHLVAAAGETEREKLFHRNAVRVYRIN